MRLALALATSVLLTNCATAAAQTLLEPQRAILAMRSASATECSRLLCPNHETRCESTKEYFREKMPAAVQCTRKADELMRNQLDAARKQSSTSLLDDLLSSGYTIVKQTRIRGEFEGCGIIFFIPLQDGGQFLCKADALSAGYSPRRPISNPPVLLLRAPSGRADLLVDNVVIEGEGTIVP